MIQQIRAEIRKILTIRSTYGILLFCLVITFFFAFYAEGLKATHAVTDPHYLFSEVSSALSALSLFLSFVGVLLVTHEYRYSTIMYTLTLANKRWKVLLSKFIVVSLFMILVSILFGVLSPALTTLGLHIKGTHLVEQSLPFWDIAWRAVFYGWAYGVLGFIVAVLVRNQVAAIITLFAIPSTVEQLLRLVMHDNVKYLPFTALGNVLTDTRDYSHGTAAGIVVIYVVVGLIAAGILFQSRDAN